MEPAADIVFQFEQADIWSFILRLTLAGFLGGIVGVERAISGHPAGLRTNLLIATSSCLFTLLSIHGFPQEGATRDTARIAAQIVTGVGFLGAGAVIHSKGSIYGMTTAATIWMVAAVGMSIATDLYWLGIITTLMTTIVLALLAPLSNWLAARTESMQKRAGQDSE